MTAKKPNPLFAGLINSLKGFGYSGGVVPTKGRDIADIEKELKAGSRVDIGPRPSETVVQISSPYGPPSYFKIDSINPKIYEKIRKQIAYDQMESRMHRHGKSRTAEIAQMIDARLNLPTGASVKDVEGMQFKGKDVNDLDEEEMKEFETFIKQQTFAQAYGGALTSFAQAIAGATLSTNELHKSMDALSSTIRKEDYLAEFPPEPQPLAILTQSQKTGRTMLEPRRKPYGRQRDMILSLPQQMRGHRMERYDFVFAHDFNENPHKREIAEQLRHKLSPFSTCPHPIWEWEEGGTQFCPMHEVSNLLFVKGRTLRREGWVRHMGFPDIERMRIREGVTLLEEDEKEGFAIYQILERATQPRESLPEDDIDLTGEL